MKLSNISTLFVCLIWLACLVEAIYQKRTDMIGTTIGAVWEVRGRGLAGRWEDKFPAYTVAELGEMLPDGFYTTKKGSFWLSWHDEEGLFGVDGNYISDCTEADARAKMLIRLVECGRVTP